MALNWWCVPCSPRIMLVSSCLSNVVLDTARKNCKGWWGSLSDSCRLCECSVEWVAVCVGVRVCECLSILLVIWNKGELYFTGGFYIFLQTSDEWNECRTFFSAENIFKKFSTRAWRSVSRLPIARAWDESWVWATHKSKAATNGENPH